MTLTARNAFTVVGRELLALIFILAGLSQIADYAEISTYLAAYNMSHLFLPSVIALEIVAGLALALGFYTRLAATTLGAYALLDMVLFMFPPANTVSFLPIVAQLALVAGLIYFAACGGGRVSVDSFLTRVTQRIGERPDDTAQFWAGYGRGQRPCQV